MKTVFALIAVSCLILLGCCSATAPSQASSACQYGTYGSACNEICDNFKPGDETCFTKCMDGIRSEGLGDATTCCKQSFRQFCDKTCAPMQDEDLEDCYIECTGAGAINIYLDKCYVSV